MAVQFKDDTDWKQREDTLWGVDNWGLDTARCMYRGRRTAKAAFEDSLGRWTAMDGYPTMKLSHWNGSGGTPSFPGIELNYIGFRSGSVPPVKIVNDTSLQSANAEGTNTATGKKVTGTFLYRASRTCYTWFQSQAPKRLAPLYSTVRDPVDPFTTIISYSIQDEDGTTVNSISLASFVAVFNKLIRKEIVTNFESEEIHPGALWACRVDVDYKLIN